MTINLSDAHIFKGGCQLRYSSRCTQRRAGLLSLHNGKWPAERATNGKRDTIEACGACSVKWMGKHPRAAMWRPVPEAR